MALPDPSPRPPRWRKALALFLVTLLFLGTSLLVLANFEAFQRFFRGIPDNTWAFSATQADQLRAMGLTGEGVILCVVDSGVDVTHPDLRNVNLVAWKDLVRGEVEPYDDNGHGTFMVGLIAGSGLVHGFAPRVSLVVAKAIDAQGEGRPFEVSMALVFCMDPFGNGTKAHIISLSLGGGGQLPGGPVAARVNDAIRQGILVVAAVGNEGPDAPDVQNPASEELVIAVGSVNVQLQVSPFSQGGDNSARNPPNQKPEIIAPGQGLGTTGLQGGYFSISGTSAASAIASAILALVFQGEPALQALTSSLGVSTVKVALMDTARALDGQGQPHDRLAGYGIIQGVNLLDALRLGA